MVPLRAEAHPRSSARAGRERRARGRASSVSSVSCADGKLAAPCARGCAGLPRSPAAGGADAQGALTFPGHLASREAARVWSAGQGLGLRSAGRAREGTVPPTGFPCRSGASSSARSDARRSHPRVVPALKQRSGHAGSLCEGGSPAGFRAELASYFSREAGTRASERGKGPRRVASALTW